MLRDSHRHPTFYSLLIAVCFLIPVAHAEYAIIYRTNGDRYTGTWRGGNENEYVLDLLDGQRLRIPVSETKYIIMSSDTADLPGVRAQEDFTRGQQFLELGMKEDAESAFRQAIHQSPRFADAHYALAQLLEAQENIEEAMRYYSFAAQIAPERFQFADRFKAAAERYLQEGEPLKAAEIFLTIARQFPEDPAAESAIFQAGFLFAAQYEQLIRQQNELTEDQNLDALLEKGIKALQEGMMNYPDYWDIEQARYTIGILNLERKSYTFAYQQLTEFIDMYPESDRLARAYLARGRAALAQRLNRDALEDFNKALRLTTDSTLAMQARDLRNQCAWQTYYAADGLPSNLIQAVAVDGDFLWVGTPKGLAKFDTSLDGWTPMPMDVQLPRDVNVYTLATDDENVWIGTLNNGLYHYNKILQSTEQFISGEKIYDIDLYEDEVWIGTFNGLRYYNTNTGEWLHLQQGLPALDVTAVTATPGSVWIGTSQNGIGIFDKTTKEWQILSRMSGLPAPIGDSIRSLDYDLDRVWFTWYTSRANGYGWYDLNQNKVFGDRLLEGDMDPLKDVFVGLADQQVWIVHNVAVFIQDLISNDWNTVEKLTTLGEVTAIEVGGGAAWIGTTNGLGKIDSIIVARTTEGLTSQ